MTRSWHAVLLLPVIILVIVFSLPASADAVSDGIDSARVKSRAGKHADALAELDGMLLVHAADPRVQYQRALVLKELKRGNDAADAIEAAQAAMDAYEKEGGTDQGVLAIKPGMKTEAAALLKYRIEARKLLADFHAKGVETARKLLEERRPVEAQYVIDELEGASPELCTGEDFTALVVAVKDSLRAAQNPAQGGK